MALRSDPGDSWPANDTLVSSWRRIRNRILEVPPCRAIHARAKASASAIGPPTPFSDGIDATDVFDEWSDAGGRHARKHQLMWRRPACAADDAVRVMDGRPIGRGIRRRTSARVERDAEQQIVLGLGLEQPRLRGVEKALGVGVPLDRERRAHRASRRARCAASRSYYAASRMMWPTAVDDAGT